MSDYFERRVARYAGRGEYAQPKTTTLLAQPYGRPDADRVTAQWDGAAQRQRPPAGERALTAHDAPASVAAPGPVAGERSAADEGSIAPARDATIPTSASADVSAGPPRPPTAVSPDAPEAAKALPVTAVREPTLIAIAETADRARDASLTRAGPDEAGTTRPTPAPISGPPSPEGVEMTPLPPADSARPEAPRTPIDPARPESTLLSSGTPEPAGRAESADRMELPPSMSPDPVAGPSSPASGPTVEQTGGRQTSISEVAFPPPHDHPPPPDAAVEASLRQQGHAATAGTADADAGAARNRPADARPDPVAARELMGPSAEPSSTPMRDTRRHDAVAAGADDGGTVATPEPPAPAGAEPPIAGPAPSAGPKAGTTVSDGAESISTAPQRLASLGTEPHAAADLTHPSPDAAGDGIPPPPPTVPDTRHPTPSSEPLDTRHTVGGSESIPVPSSQTPPHQPPPQASDVPGAPPRSTPPTDRRIESGDPPHLVSGDDGGGEHPKPPADGDRTDLAHEEAAGDRSVRRAEPAYRVPVADADRRPAYGAATPVSPSPLRPVSIATDEQGPKSAVAAPPARNSAPGIPPPGMDIAEEAARPVLPLVAEAVEADLPSTRPGPMTAEQEAVTFQGAPERPPPPHSPVPLAESAVPPPLQHPLPVAGEPVIQMRAAEMPRMVAADSRLPPSPGQREGPRTDTPGHDVGAPPRTLSIAPDAAADGPADVSTRTSPPPSARPEDPGRTSAGPTDPPPLSDIEPSFADAPQDPLPYGPPLLHAATTTELPPPAPPSSPTMSERPPARAEDRRTAAGEDSARPGAVERALSPPAVQAVAASPYSRVASDRPLGLQRQETSAVPDGARADLSAPEAAPPAIAEAPPPLEPGDGVAPHRRMDGVDEAAPRGRHEAATPRSAGSQPAETTIAAPAEILPPFSMEPKPEVRVQGNGSDFEGPPQRADGLSAETRRGVPPPTSHRTLPQPAPRAAPPAREDPTVRGEPPTEAVGRPPSPTDPRGLSAVSSEPATTRPVEPVAASPELHRPPESLDPGATLPRGKAASATRAHDSSVKAADLAHPVETPVERPARPVALAEGRRRTTEAPPPPDGDLHDQAPSPARRPTLADAHQPAPAGRPPLPAAQGETPAPLRGRPTFTTNRPPPLRHAEEEKVAVPGDHSSSASTGPAAASPGPYADAMPDRQDDHAPPPARPSIDRISHRDEPRPRAPSPAPPERVRPDPPAPPSSVADPRPAEAAAGAGRSDPVAGTAIFEQIPPPRVTTAETASTPPPPSDTARARRAEAVASPLPEPIALVAKPRGRRRANAHAEAPVGLHLRIHRIDVHAPVAAPRAMQTPAPRDAALSLDDYLKRRKDR